MEPRLTSKCLVTSALNQLSSIDANTNTNSAQDRATSTPASTATFTSRYPPKTSNSLTSLSTPSVKLARSALLTLHFLFPFDFLPALDLIDRQLIQRLHVSHQHPLPRSDPDPDPNSDQDNPPTTVPTTTTTTFYVQSASALTTSSNKSGSKGGGRFGNRNYAATRVHYEVRLDSWNCSCPAFAAAGLRLVLSEVGAGRDQRQVRDQSADENVCERKHQVVDEGQDDGAAIDEGDMVDKLLIGGIATKDDALTPVCKHILAAALCDAAPGLFGGGMKSREVSVDEMAAWAAGWGET